MRTQDTVVLMTLHSAKGLISVVFIAARKKGVPSYLSIGNKEEWRRSAGFAMG